MLDIKNRHIAACGTPPDFTQMRPDWVSYFENPDREQFVFVVKDGKAFVYDGDGGWGNPKEVQFSEGLMLSPLCEREEEEMWVRCCWNSSYWWREGKSRDTNVPLVVTSAGMDGINMALKMKGLPFRFREVKG